MRIINYLDLGFDEFLRAKRPESQMISANDMDAFNDLAESSIRSNKLRDEAIINSKLKDAAVNENKIASEAVTNAKIKNMVVSKLLTGTISVVANVGDGNVKIDGSNKRILINDGTNDRILLGYLAGKF